MTMHAILLFLSTLLLSHFIPISAVTSRPRRQSSHDPKPSTHPHDPSLDPSQHYTSIHKKQQQSNPLEIETRFKATHADKKSSPSTPTNDALDLTTELTPDVTSRDVEAASDPRAVDLQKVKEALHSPEKFTASKIRALMKERKQLNKEMISGLPDPSTDVKYQQSIDGVDRIGAGFDASDGALKLPTLVWKAYMGDECAPGKTGRWCNTASMDNIFFNKQLPAAIAVTRETEAHSSVVRRVFTGTKDLASREAEEMSFRSPIGVMTQEQDVAMLREVQTHSDLMLARREQKLYTLKLYPFQSQAKDTAYVKSELLEAFLSTVGAAAEESGSSDSSSSSTDGSSTTTIPDCMLHDCMIRDERDDMPMTGCQFEGMKVSVPSCVDLNKKEQISLKEGCQSKFFLTLPKKLQSKTYTSTSNPACTTSKDIAQARAAGPTAAACSAYGVDLGTVCNANDMKRLGQFVSRWGKFFFPS